MEQVGAIEVDAFPMAVDCIVGVAAEVGSAVDHMHAVAGLGTLPGHHCSGKARAHHEHPQVGHYFRPKSADPRGNMLIESIIGSSWRVPRADRKGPEATSPEPDVICP
jgi:hypothetical protein